MQNFFLYITPIFLKFSIQFMCQSDKLMRSHQADSELVCLDAFAGEEIDKYHCKDTFHS